MFDVAIKPVSNRFLFCFPQQRKHEKPEQQFMSEGNLHEETL